MKKALLFSLAIGLAVASYGQKSTPEKLDELVSSYANVGQFNGAILVAKEGKILLQKGYGIKNYKKGELLSDNDIFELYSITKTFTSTLILKLAEEDKINVSDKLEKYFPGFPEGKVITIENLLTHTSGIYDYTRGNDMPDMREKTFVDFLKTKPLDFPPGTQWNYSNSGYWLLGFIIEKVTGKSYEMALKHYIFKPLKMKTAGLDYINLMSKYRTTGYEILTDSIKKEAEVYSSPGPFAAGAIYATVVDMYNYYIGIKENKILHSGSYAKAFIPYKNGYGYGWVISEFDEKKTVGHSGGGAGFRTNFVMIPENDICIVILSNTESDDARFITDKLLEVLYNKPYVIPAEIRVDNEILSLYKGYYKFKESSIHVSVSGRRLAAQKSGGPKFELLALTNDYFYSPKANIYLGFQRDENKQYKLLIHQGNDITKAERFIPSWGVIGSATTNGWDGKDIKMTSDTVNKMIWKILGIKLVAGEMKFRFNNDWNESYGDNSQDRILENDGENIQVEAGLYDIVLDLTDPKAPKYSISNH
nr:serine hydrolase [uncultured Flavobacterium sp.]